MLRNIIFLLIIIISILLIFLVFKKYFSKNKVEEEKSKDLFANSSLQKCKIKVDFIKSKLLNGCKLYEKSLYSLKKEEIAADTTLITQEVKDSLLSEIDREIKLGVKKELLEIDILDKKVIFIQDNSLLYTILNIDVIVPIYVKYKYYHISSGNLVKEEFYTKKFNFISIDGNWQLNKVSEKEMKSINEYFYFKEL